MRLTPVTGPLFTCTCVACGHRGYAGTSEITDESFLADLDGEAYKAYYCASCARQIQDKT